MKEGVVGGFFRRHGMTGLREKRPIEDACAKRFDDERGEQHRFQDGAERGEPFRRQHVAEQQFFLRAHLLADIQAEKRRDRHNAQPADLNERQHHKLAGRGERGGRVHDNQAGNADRRRNGKQGIYERDAVRGGFRQHQQRGAGENHEKETRGDKTRRRRVKLREELHDFDNPPEDIHEDKELKNKGLRIPAREKINQRDERQRVFNRILPEILPPVMAKNQLRDVSEDKHVRHRDQAVAQQPLLVRVHVKAVPGDKQRDADKRVHSDSPSQQVEPSLFVRRPSPLFHIPPHARRKFRLCVIIPNYL